MELIYLFKFNEEFDGDIFEKDCLKQKDQWTPYSRDATVENIVNEVKVSINEIGCYISGMKEEFAITNKLGFGFIVNEYDYINEKRHIKNMQIILVNPYILNN